MSTTRMSVTHSGIRLTLVRMSSGIGQRHRALQEAHLDGPVRGDLGIDQLSDPGRESFRQRAELEVHAGCQRFPCSPR